MDNNENKIFVGNLDFKVDTEDLKEAFLSCGTVKSAKVLIHRETNESRGFGFVQFENKGAFEAALQKNNEALRGRNMIVNVAK